MVKYKLNTIMCRAVIFNKNTNFSFTDTDTFSEEINKNEMWAETQTLRCIIEGGGDVAFINTFHMDQYLGMYT